jgi:hypothetical protein
MSHVKLMSWCKLKLWHLKFHHNENPQKHLSLQWVQSVLYWEQMKHVMCKWIHICNDVDSGQQVKKPPEHLLIWEWGLLSRFWIPCYIRMGHTCNDLHNEHIVAFGAYTYFNGCKMCYIGNKNNLSCVNGYTYVVMLIMYKLYLEHIHNSMGAKCVILVTTTCYVWKGTHMYDVDNVQVAFGIHIHKSNGCKMHLLVTRITCYVWVHTHM